MTPRLQAHIDIFEAARRDGQRIADIERAHRLLRGTPPDWADPRAFRAAIETVWSAYPDPAVFRTGGVAQALLNHVLGRRRRSHRKDRSPGALAVRAYAGSLRVARVGRALRFLAIAVPSLFFGAGLVLGLWNWLF